MKRSFIITLKISFLLAATFIVFSALKKLIGTVGNFPKSFETAYGQSFFIKHGIFLPALIVLFSIILILLIINFMMIKKGIHKNKILQGFLYGFSFGMLWFIAFLELIFIYHSNSAFNNIKSGIRDLVSLSVFGILLGLLFGTDQEQKIVRKPIELTVIPIVAICFYIFHSLQYYLTFPELKQSISTLVSALWLFLLGCWFGFIYYLLAPGIKIQNRLIKAIYFSFLIVGTNWLLYNLFYNLFLSIPILDLSIRCLLGMVGIFIGLIIYNYFFNKNRIAMESGN